LFRKSNIIAGEFYRNKNEICREAPTVGAFFDKGIQ